MFGYILPINFVILYNTMGMLHLKVTLKHLPSEVS